MWKAKTVPTFARKRQLLVFDRLLARIVAVFGEAAMLKGGLVLELRIERARTTKDVDLRMTGSPDDILARLQHATRRDLGDFMTYEVRPDPERPNIHNDGTQYDGQRFRAECRLAGKIYGQPFGVDIAFGDPVLGEPEVVVADDLLAFAGISRRYCTRALFIRGMGIECCSIVQAVTFVQQKIQQKIQHCVATSGRHVGVSFDRRLENPPVQIRVLHPTLI